MKHTRLLALLLTLCLMVGGVAACGDSQPAATTPSDTTTTTTAESASQADTTTTAAPTESVTTADTTKPSQVTSSKPEKTTKPSSSTTVTTKKPSKNIVTYTTEATTTTTTKDKSKGKAIKVLAIGNSFSVDAMNNHLFQIFESAGYTDITLGNLYIGGCSLDTHYGNLKDNNAAYEYYKNTDGEWSKLQNTTPGSALTSARWDVVTIQQVSSDSGRPQTYVKLEKTLEMIKQKSPRAKILWHMTWAYQKNSDHWAFAHYNNDQMQMYNAIVSAVRSAALPYVDGIIPAGTAIQNLRTSELGDTLTSDGHHLKDSYGDYTAALTWFCTITGENPTKVTYWPAAVDSYKDEILQSVKNAVQKPFEVTKCK